MTVPKTIYFEGLDLLRCIAAFVLMFYHIALHYDMHPILKMFVHNMVIGVDFFFIISGFLIVFFLIEEKKQTSAISIKHFYTKRVLRIFPLYYFIIFLATILYQVPHTDFVQFIFFVGNFGIIENNHFPSIPLLVPLWSLCIEEQFYLGIPFLIWWTPLKNIHHLFIILFLLSISYRGWCVWEYEHFQMNIYFHTLSRCDALLIGAIIAYKHSLYKFNVHINKYAFSLILLSVLLPMLFINSSNDRNILDAMFRKYLFVIPMTLVFLGVVLNTNKDHKILHWLKTNRILSYFGKISFGIYMYQFLVTTYIRESPILTQSFLFYSVSSIIGTTILAIISYELFEKRIINLKKKVIT